MKYLILFVAMSIIALSSEAQSIDYYKLHDQVKEPSITHKYSRHSDIEPLVKKLANHADFEVTHLGNSVQGRSINLVKWGAGERTVLLWSQMHGNEPTATMALMDIFRLLEHRAPGFDAIREKLHREVTLLFIPMLNPDGAQVYERRNAVGVDLNRDALRLTNPEARILKQVRDEYNPLFGFNLHDQNRFYGAGVDGDPVAIAFLAPAYNHEKDVNDVRLRAMQLIGALNEVLEPYIPGRIAKYDDTFEPRAFGDNIQKWGTSTILVESGGYPDDNDNQYLRKLNFVLLMEAFESIASDSYATYDEADYEAIPFNRGNGVHDLMVKNVTVQLGTQTFTLDLAWRNQRLADVGDLSTTTGYDVFDADGYTIRDLSGSDQQGTFVSPGGNPVLLLENKDGHRGIITNGRIFWLD